MTNQAKLASLVTLLVLTGCAAPQGPSATPAPSPSATSTAWKCSDFLRHGKFAIAVPPSITETGCMDDSGQLAAPETLSCANGMKLVFVDHWAVTEKVVVDLRTTSDMTMRQSCLGG